MTKLSKDKQHSMDTATLTLQNNKEENQFEFHVDGSVARLEYVLSNDRIFLTHTEVPKKLQGQGIASALVKRVFEKIEDEYDLPVVPLCPFVANYIKSHPQWNRLVFRGVTII